MKRLILTLALLIAAPLSAEVPFDTGQQAVTGTAAALPDKPGKVACIKVKAGGSQTVYYGFSSSVTTSTGMEIAVSEKVCRPISNLNKIYVIAASTGSTVAYEVYQ